MVSLGQSPLLNLHFVLIKWLSRAILGSGRVEKTRK